MSKQHVVSRAAAASARGDQVAAPGATITAELAEVGSRGRQRLPGSIVGGSSTRLPDRPARHVALLFVVGALLAGQAAAHAVARPQHDASRQHNTLQQSLDRPPDLLFRYLKVMFVRTFF